MYMYPSAGGYFFITHYRIITDFKSIYCSSTPTFAYAPLTFTGNRTIGSHLRDHEIYEENAIARIFTCSAFHVNSCIFNIFSQKSYTIHL